jgi:hypothetical protein
MAGDLIIVTRITRPTLAGVLRGPNSRILQESEVLGLAYLYWPSNQWENATKIAKCESGYETGAWAYIGEDSRGLWQLNVEAHPEMGQYDLFDPQINAYFAHKLWAEQGWGPWTCAKILNIV